MCNISLTKTTHNKIGSKLLSYHNVFLTCSLGIRFPSGDITGTEGQQLMVCIVLETTLAGGLANEFTVTLAANVASGTDHTMTGYNYILYTVASIPVQPHH